MTVRSQLLQTFLCLPVPGGPSAAADIQRSSDRVPDSPSWLVEAARRETEKDGGPEREEPAEPREGEAGASQASTSHQHQVHVVRKEQDLNGLGLARLRGQ